MQAHESLVVVIDDDEGVCRSISRILTASGYRARTHARADDYLAVADHLEPECVLLDIRMPGEDGIDVARRMREMGLDAPIVFMTATGDVPTVVDAMKQGALDLLAKPFSSETLLSAVARAIESAHQHEQAHRDLAALWQLFARLTPREAEICGMVTCGLANKHVAARTGITEKTVKVHRGRVMHKLAAGSLAELVRLVERLAADKDTTMVRFDGADIVRPRAVDIVLQAMSAHHVESAGIPSLGAS